MSDAAFAEPFRPKLITVLAEPYGLADLRADLMAGLTVAIVALPLSMAIAIASSVGPERGLYTSIVGGFLVSALGGSRFQIGGPAGAFIVLVASTVARHGLDGLLLATLLSGVILALVGALRLGAFIKYIPYPVTVGFTAGIAVIIFASQLKDLLGLRLAGKEPGPLLPKLEALAGAAGTVSPAAVGVALGAIAVILLVRRWRPHWPAMLIAVAGAAVAAWALALPVETIASRFGELPRGLPAPRLPPISPDRLAQALPDAFSFALLGGIESLLSAVVADSMSGRRHRSNVELLAQGLANIGSALFGGICVTGTIARTATNVRAGARGPVAGMAHALLLLLFLLVAAPLAGFIPLAALAGVLAVVAWNMAEKDAFVSLLRASRGDAVVLGVTFLLVVFRDLTEGIVVGFALSALLILHRMARSVQVSPGAAPQTAGTGDPEDGVAFAPALTRDDQVAVCRISGAFFFGAAAAVAAALDRIGEHPRAYVIDVSAAPLIDSSAAAAIEGFARRAANRGAAVYIAGAGRQTRRLLLRQGLRPPHVRYREDLDGAVAAARRRAGAGTAA